MSKSITFDGQIHINYLKNYLKLEAHEEIITITICNIPGIRNLCTIGRPASEYMMIRSSTPDRNLDIFNAMGQLILSQQNVQNGSMVDISDLETGLYFVKSENSIQKLIIE